jgi:hypothetical protein
MGHFTNSLKLAAAKLNCRGFDPDKRSTARASETQRVDFAGYAFGITRKQVER